MRNSLTVFTFILLLNFTSKLTHAQIIADFDDISVFFGDKQKSNSNVDLFLKTKSNKLLCIQKGHSFFNLFSRHDSKYSFNFISGYKIPETHPITFYGNGKKSNLAHYTVLGDNILGVSSQSNLFRKGEKLYFHLINLSAQGKSNHGFSMNDYFSFYNEIDLSQITLVSSHNKKFASMIYVHKSSLDNYRSIKYLSFKEGTPIPQSGDFIYPFPSQEYEFLDYYIKDETTQYIASGHYMEIDPPKNELNTLTHYKSITIGKIANQKFSYDKIEDNGKFYTEVGLYNDDEQIIISGLYSSFMDSNIEGVFTAKINQAGEITDKKYTPFSEDVVASISGFSLDLFNDQSTIKNEYAGFDLLEFQSTRDGYIGIAEYNALEYRYGSTDVPGATNTVDSYFWSNDIIVFKLKFNGELDWDRIIPKYQRSINDGGYYLSNTVYLNEKNLHLFFNDNQMNYDDDGRFNRVSEPPISAQFSSSKNTIAHVSISLKNGNMNRTSTIGKEETDLLFVPLLSRPFVESKKLMIYGRSGNKQKLGSISFHD